MRLGDKIDRILFTLMEMNGKLSAIDVQLVASTKIIDEHDKRLRSLEAIVAKHITEEETEDDVTSNIYSTQHKVKESMLNKKLGWLGIIITGLAIILPPLIHLLVKNIFDIDLP